MSVLTQARRHPRELLLSACLVTASLHLASCSKDTVIGVWNPAASGAASSGGVSAIGGSAGASGGGGGEVAQPDAFYFEAESGDLSGPFIIGTSDAASGGKFLEASETSVSDQPGDGRARYSFTLESAGTYLLWGRVHSPDPPQSRFFLRFDDDAFLPWRIATGDVWFWDDVHEDDRYLTPLTFELDGGEHVLEVASSQTGAQLDRFYLTARGDVPPGNDTPCNPPHSIEVDGACIPSCGSHGDTTCDTAACEGKPALEAVDCIVCCFVN